MKMLPLLVKPRSVCTKKSITTSKGEKNTEQHRCSQVAVKAHNQEESDEEMRRVPEFGSEQAFLSISHHTTNGGTATPRKRGKSTTDKEKHKRLLRNRVSAQQARERKKAYMSDLEIKVKDLETKNSELDDRLSTLQNENRMLRQILKKACSSWKK